MPYKDKAIQNAYQNQRLKRRRIQWLVDNGPCVECGSWEELEVDHKDRSTKVDHKVWSWSQQRRDEELAKCQVLCKTCHRNKTNNELRRPITHGASNGYKKHGCRCELCRAWNMAECLEWKIRTNYRGVYGKLA